MKAAFSLNKEITTRDLAILQKLYRSREFKNKLSLSVFPLKANTHTFIVYGSRNALSSVQRGIFRNHLNKTTDFSHIIVKLTLFSSTVAQYITGYSSLLKLENLLKGTTYQITLTINNVSEEEAFVQLFAFLNYVKVLKFSDQISFNFSPAIIFPSANNVQKYIAPRRVKYLQNLVSSNIQQKEHIMFNLISTINSPYSSIILRQN